MELEEEEKDYSSTFEILKNILIKKIMKIIYVL
jgi:hypothetical protein